MRPDYTNARVVHVTATGTAAGARFQLSRKAHGDYFSIDYRLDGKPHRASFCPEGDLYRLPDVVVIETFEAQR